MDDFKPLTLEERIYSQVYLRKLNLLHLSSLSAIYICGVEITILNGILLRSIFCLVSKSDYYTFCFLSHTSGWTKK